MIDERGLRNSVHSDRQSIIAAYAVEFATHATNVFTSYVPRVQLDMGEFFDAAFRDNIPEIVKSAAARLRLKMKKEEAKAVEAMIKSIETTESYNAHPELIFTPNDHYLNGLIAECKDNIEEQSDIDLSDQGTLNIIYNVMAYIKVQRKFVTELAAKEFVRIFFIGNEESCHRILLKELKNLVELVNEPVKISRERQLLLQRKTVLEDALKHVNI